MTKETEKQHEIVERMNRHGLKQATHWLPSVKQMPTQYGYRTHAEWAQLEAERINKSPDHRAKVANCGAAVALFVSCSLPRVRSQDWPVS
jgi:hypothetical protein